MLQQLQRISQLYSQKQFADVISLCEQGLSQTGSVTELHQWLIQSYLAIGNINAARAAFASASKDGHKSHLTHLDARICQLEGNVQGELTALNTLLKSNSRNIALLTRKLLLTGILRNAADAKATLALLESMLSANDAALLRAKMDFYKQVEWYDLALSSAKALSRISPQDIRIRHDLGLLARLAGDTELAINELQKVAQATTHFAVQHNLANAYADNGELNKAIIHYQKAIALNSHYVESYVNLSLLEWETGKGGKFASCFQPMLAQRHPAFVFAYVNLLLDAKRYDAATETLLSFDELNNQTVWRLLMAKARRGTGDFAQSFAMTQALLAVDGTTEIAIEATISAIEHHDYDSALASVEGVLNREPDNQLAVAYWHATKKAMSLPGLDVTRYVSTYALLDDNEQSQRTTFLAELTAYVNTLHSAVEQPLNQTLEKGTQTRGHLFSTPAPVIQALKAAIDKAVFAFIEQQGMDKRRLTNAEGDPHYAGSWSVKLQGKGYHQNHIHSYGRISGVVYLALPDEVKDETTKQGWLTLGKPYRYSEDSSEPDLYVKPELLRCVLFRSFLWHGTTPIVENSARMTIAFDVGEYGKIKYFYA